MSELPMSAEERLAALERKVNMMWNGGGNLLGTEGYLQIGTSGSQGAVRFDGNAVQVATGSANDSAGAVFLVPDLDANPLLNGPQTVLTGRHNAGAGSVTAFLTTKLNPTQIGSGANAFLGLFANASFSQAMLQADFQDDGNGVYIKVIDEASDPRIVWSLNGGGTEYELDGALWTDLTDGGETALHTHGGGMELIVKTADESVNNSGTGTTLQDDDHLVIPIGANQNIQFEGYIFATGSTPDIKIAATGPTGSVGRISVGSAGSDDLGGGGLTVALDADIAFRGSVDNGSTAGSITIQWAQNASSPNNTTVHAGSFIKWQVQ